MKQKKLSPIQKHSARVVIMFFVIIFSTVITCIIVDGIINYLFNTKINTDASFVALWIMFIVWNLNIRLGFIENIVQNNKKHNNFDLWFGEVKE
jgi:hypothetical protein